MISVKFDPTIELPDIQMPIYSETEANDPKVSEHDVSIIQQTKLDGIMVPLVRINNQTIFYTQIIHMELSCDDMPKLYIEINDQLGLIKNLDTPGWDNMLQLQILPPFDGGYKKINLLFYMTNVRIDGFIMRISAVYHVPKLWDCRMEAYGKISTYEYLEKMAKELGLGFASNMNSIDDARYIYNPMRSIPSNISSVVSYAHNGKDDNKSIFAWWIDYWNTLNFVNVYDEYNEIVPEDQMLIWVQDTGLHPAGDDNSGGLTQMIAALNNHPATGQTAMTISEYTPVYSSMGATDQIFETWHIDEQDYQTTYIENGDAMDNIYKNYQYGGEVFGDYDYLARTAARSMFLSKMNSQTIRTSISVPTLGRIIGDKINVWWYDSDNYITTPLQELANPDIETNIDVPQDLHLDGNSFVINKMISGQYFIENMSFIYDTEFQWRQEFVLSRDGSKKESYNPPVKEESEKN